MKIISLHRWAQNTKATHGRLTVDGHARGWLTVERPATDVAHPCIPPGTYRLKLGMYYGGDGVGGAHPDYPAYEVLGVPGRSLIKIHGANQASQLLGCIAPGLELGIFGGEIGVTSSRPALAEFMAAMGGEAEGTLAVTEGWG